jgi:hypothetical protein
MRLRVAPCCLALVLGWAQVPVRAEEEDPLAKLSGAEALAIAQALSTDAMKGRKTGFEGGRRAADYVAQAMGSMGLDPKDPEVKAPITLSLGGQALEYGIDFGELVNSGRGKIDGEVVFVGYGIAAPAKGFDEYAGADIKGKVLLALAGAPKGRAEDLRSEASIAYKVRLAREGGAKALLLCAEQRALVPPIPPDGLELELPSLWLSAKAADRLLARAKTSLDAQRAARDATTTAVAPMATGAKAAFEVKIDHLPRAQGHNGLGAIRGRHPDLRREVVLVGAHMDHLGVDALGRVYNGADDNASGLAVLLHVAHTLVEAGWQPKRMILFVAFGGTDQGLVGSRYLTEGLPFEHDGIVCVLNVDRVGLGGTDVVIAGSDPFPKMSERLTTYVPDALRKGVTRTGSSDAHGDHLPFRTLAPTFLLTTKGERPHAFTPEDDAEHLKPECLEAAARVLGALIVRLGDEPTPLKGEKAEGAR